MGEKFESQLQLLGKRLLEESLRVEQWLEVGAGHYQRTTDRCGYRNGYYSRDAIWKLGVVSKVLVRRKRSGVCRSAILEGYRRFGEGFDRYILQMFSLGLATGRVERFFTGFFGEYGSDAQTVSDILRLVSFDLQRYRSRRLSDDVRYLYLIAYTLRFGGFSSQVCGTVCVSGVH